MSWEIEGPPWEWTQAPLRCGAVYCLCNQLASHPVVRHLYRETEMGEEGTKVEVSEYKEESEVVSLKMFGFSENSLTL